MLRLISGPEEAIPKWSGQGVGSMKYCALCCANAIGDLEVCFARNITRAHGQITRAHVTTTTYIYIFKINTEKVVRL